jgi:RNA polymerase sigma factor (sigma-70 family)
MTEPPPPETHFATTRWTQVWAAARGGDTPARDALAGLCSAYWRPLYRFARRRGCSPADAEDLVQGFFARLIGGDGLRHADPEKGRFRTFMLAGLKHHMTNEWRRDHRDKRGGFATHISIHAEAEDGPALEPADPAASEHLYDREWAIALLDRVLADLEKEEGTAFTLWKPFLALGEERSDYAAAARASGLTEGAVRVTVHRLRKRYRHRLRAEIAGTLADDRMVDEEMRSLFAALGGNSSARV